MSRNTSTTPPRPLLRWLLVVRAVLVLALGVAFLRSGPRYPLLGNLLGTFWLVGALLTLRWARTNRGKTGARAARVAGLVGITGAVIALARSLIEDAFSTETVLALLGVTAVAIGLLRIAGAFRDHDEGAASSAERLVLGVSETCIGVIWIAVDDLSGSVSAAAGIFALVAGAVMLLDALELWRRSRPA